MDHLHGLYEAIRTVQEASYNWCEYLTENGREDETEPIDVANDTLDKLVKLLR